MANKVVVISGKNVDYGNKPTYIDLDMHAKTVLTNSDQKLNVSKLTDLNAIKNSLRQIFTWIPGERVILPEFGSHLREMLYEGITDYNVEMIMSEIKMCASKWEPRASIDKVINISTNEDTEDNVVHLEVVYSVPGLTGNSQYSLELTYNIHSLY